MFLVTGLGREYHVGNESFQISIFSDLHLLLLVVTACSRYRVFTLFDDHQAVCIVWLPVFLSTQNQFSFSGQVADYISSAFATVKSCLPFTGLC